MSSYTRPKVPGACVFFTVNLVDRGADTLLQHVEVLRRAVAMTRAKRPFKIDAWVVLPDHIALRVDVAGGGCGLLRSVARDQSAIFDGAA